MRFRYVAGMLISAALLLLSCGSNKGTSPTGGGDTTAPGAIIDLRVNSVNGDAILLTWTAPGDDNLTGQATGYDLRYSTAQITSGNFASATEVTGEPTPKVAGSLESMVVHVTTLAAKTDADITYYFAVRAVDEAENWSALSNVVNTTVQDTTPPATVTDLAVTAITDSSVTIQWTAPGNDGSSGTASTYDIRYSDATINDGNWAGATPVNGEPIPQAAGTVQSMEVIVSTTVASRLATGTDATDTWFLAMRTIDDSGNESVLSNVVSAQVGDDVAPAAVSDLDFTGLTDSSVFLSWTAPGDDGGTGTAAVYDIRYSTSALNGSTWDAATQVSGEPAPASAGTQQAMEVVVGTAIAVQLAADVQTDSTWYFGLRTVDDALNQSAISNVVSTQLTDMTPPAPISDLEIDSFTDSTVTLTWTATGDNGIVGTATSYDIRYATAEIDTSVWDSYTQVENVPAPRPAGTPETLLVAIDPSATLAASTADNEYYFAIRVTDDRDNTSGISNVATQSLPDITAPAAISNLQVVGFDDTSLQLSWSAPGDDGFVGTATSYDIRYSTNIIDETNWESAAAAPNPPVPQEAGTGQTYDLTGLVSGNTYYVAVRTRDEADNLSPISNVVSQLLPDTQSPSQITDLAVTATTATSITLSWTAPGDDDTVGTATSYSIRYRDQSFTESQWEDATPFANPPTPHVAGTTETWQLTGLPTGQFYYIAIRASDEADNVSGMSNVVLAIPVPSVNVTFGDQGIEAAVRDELGIPTGTLTAFDMAHVRNLFAGGHEASSLTGLEYAYNLEYADLSNNEITDLSPLSGLTHIYFLRIDENNIGSISPLSGLTSLQIVRLGGNNVTTLAPLAGLNSLHEVDAYGNQIGDLSPVTGLTNLKILRLSSNLLNSIAGIQNLTGLTSLNLGSNSISDLSPLSGLTNLTDLELSSNPISDLSPLAGLVNLQVLSLNFNAGVTSLSALSNLTNLRDLHAVGCHISSVAPLANMPEMQVLWLYNNDITTLTPLTSLINMEQLSLFGNDISDISPLAGMTKMQRLFISNNMISDLTPLAGMTEMTELNIGSNSGLSDISGLAGMIHLVSLTGWNNDIADLTPLAGLNMLSSVDLSDNPIVNLMPLQGLEEISSLNLSSTDIEDLLPLVNNPGIGSGDILTLYDTNHLSATSISTHIPALETRGVIVNR